MKVYDMRYYVQYTHVWDNKEIQKNVPSWLAPLSHAISLVGYVKVINIVG